MNTKLCSRPFSTAATRREFLHGRGASLGSVAFSHLLARDALAAAPAAGPLSPKEPMLPAKAKNVIMLFMEGGPGHMDTFDPKLVKAGSVNTDLINNTDFAPTMLELAGGKAPPQMQGHSFAAALEGKPLKNWRTATYYRYWMHETDKTRPHIQKVIDAHWND